MNIPGGAMLSKHMTLTRAAARQQEETGETGREGRGSCKKDFPRGNGAQRKQHKGKPERSERTAQIDAGGSCGHCAQTLTDPCGEQFRAQGEKAHTACGQGMAGLKGYGSNSITPARLSCPNMSKTCLWTQYPGPPGPPS